MSLLSVDNISIEFGGLKAVQDFSLELEMGELVAVDVLWVDEGHRGQGLGAAVLAHVEAQARAQGARRVELNTFGFQAPGFYEKQGYRRFGAIEPAVGEHGHYFYVKDLT